MLEQKIRISHLLDKKDMALLTQREEEEKAQAAKDAANNNPAPVIRVKVKTVR